MRVTLDKASRAEAAVKAVKAEAAAKAAAEVAEKEEAAKEAKEMRRAPTNSCRIVPTTGRGGGYTFSDGGDHIGDQLFGADWGAVANTINKAKNEGFTYTSDIESYDHSTNNYEAEVVAMLYFAHRTSLRRVMLDFVLDKHCDFDAAGGKDEESVRGE